MLIKIITIIYLKWKFEEQLLFQYYISSYFIFLVYNVKIFIMYIKYISIEYLQFSAITTLAANLIYK